MAEITKNLKCLVCGNSERFDFLESLGEYKIYKCLDCELEFVSPFKSGTRDYYEESYSALGGGYGREKWEYHKLLETAEKFGFKGKLFEAGCGPGWLLKDAQKAGFDVYGIDFNREAIEHAKSLGLSNVKVGDVAQADSFFPDTKFDAVAIFHVLEHLDNPDEVFSGIKKILKDKGILAVAVPNSERFFSKFFKGKRKEGWDCPPHHLTRWSKDNLNLFLKNNGFETFFIEEERISELVQGFNFTRGFFHLLTSPALLSKIKTDSAMVHRSRPGVQKTIRFLAIKTLSFLKKVLIILLSLIASPFFYIVSKFIFIRGTNLYILAGKKS